jgi:hypothetical protein
VNRDVGVFWNVNGVFRDGTAGDANWILHDNSLVLLQNASGRSISPASAFVVVKHALVLDECFVAVFF